MRRATVLLALGLPLAAGCYQHTYVVSGTTPAEEPAYRGWRHHLFAGLVHLSGDVELREACPQGVARVENGIDVHHAIFTVLTAFIYAPSSTEVYCQTDPPVPPPAAPPPAVPEPAADGGVPVVEHDEALDAGPDRSPRE